MPEHETITRELFASLVQKLLLSYSLQEWSFDSNNFCLNAKDGIGEQSTLSLSRLYQTYNSIESPANLLELQRQLRVLLTPTPMSSKGDRLSMLLPYLRTYVSFQHTNALIQAERTADQSFIYFPYADVLGVGLVFDKGEKVQHVTELELDKLGIGAEEAVDIAVSNLKQISMEPFRLIQAGCYTSPWKDTYDGARLLLTELFSNLTVDGEVVALTPTPSILFVTGSKDMAGIELMISLATACMKEPHNVPALPLVLRDNLWEPFTVPFSEPVFNAVNSYRMNVLNMLYKEQDTMIAESNVDKKEIFISPFALDNDRKRGYLFSKTSVVDETVCMIPETDVVEFFQRNRFGKKSCIARATFEKVLEVLSNVLTKDPTLHPGRWRMNSFPQEAEIADLGLMPPVKGLWDPPDDPEQQMADFKTLVFIAIPQGAKFTGAPLGKKNESILEFVLNHSVDSLKEFYLKKLNIGSMFDVPTEQGYFTIGEWLGAGCSREAWFGPSKKKGETLLRLIKRVNYDTPAVHNAFVKQTDDLRSLELLFGVSLLSDMKREGELKTTSDSILQMFLSPIAPDEVARFFRIQLSGPKTVYLSPEQSPHLIMNLETGVTATIKAEPEPGGTLLSLTRSLK